jgi:SAM-dependent methyltransferase
MTCQLCNGAMRPLFQKHGYWIYGCAGCGHRSADVGSPPDYVERVYGDDYFEGGGAGYSGYLNEADLLRNHGRRYGRLLKRYMPVGTVLDVGAAAGFILQGMVDEGWDAQGIEPNPRMSEHARARLNLRVETASLESFETNARFDLIAMIQVVAHFLDLQKAFRAADGLTRPGGFWLIESWNRESWTARVFGRRWHEYSPPSVVHWFTPATLKNLAELYGFREVARGRPAKWLNGAHAVSLLRHKLGKWIPEGLVPRNLPLPYPGGDLFWMVLQKQAMEQERR